MTIRKPATSTKPSATKTPVKKAPAAAKAVVEPAEKVVRAEPTAKKPKKEQKVKVVRDSFTMPEGEYCKIAEIKEAALQAGQPVKKSEVLRAGLKALAAMTPAQLKRTLAGLEKIKTGRPKKR
ncbi:MAG: hypothetical protein Q8J80_02290 [Gallionella sp.]|nr:hypothetical protein [Gallionella sp.]